MKKFLIAAVMAVLGMTASAQGTWVGGTLGFGYKSDKVDGSDAVNTTTINVAPEVGFYLNDKLAVAAEVVFGYSKTEEKTTDLAVGPYVRYNLTQAGALTVFGEVAAHYVSHKEGDADAIGGFNLQLRPGIAVQVAENWALVGKINLVEYTNLKKDSFKRNTFGVDVTSALNVGFVYTF